MLFELMLALLIGILFGVVTGLTPGVHINLVAVVLVSLSPVLLLYTSALALIVFIMSMSITHTFLDAVPAIYLGAPDDAMALGVLPGHKMLMQGKGYAAVYLTVVGSLGGLLLAILLVPFLIKLFVFSYPYLKDYVAYLLIIIVVSMILRDRFRLWALFLFLLAGTLGAITLGMPNLKNPLFPLLSGLFGVSTLLLSYMQKVKIPKQNVEKPKLDAKITTQAVSASTFAGVLISFLPGLGPAQGAVVAQQLVKNIGDKGFMILMGGINTVGMVISIVTLYSLDKARNGSVIAISQLSEMDLQNMLVLLAVCLIVGILCFYLSLFVAKKFSALITKVNYQAIVTSIIILVAALSIILSGWIGFLILIVSTAVGMIAPLKGVNRSHAMGCLILPVIIFLI